MADQCASRGALAGRMSCSGSKMTSHTFLPTLAYQIGQSMPALKSAMRQIIQDEREVMLTPDDYNFARKLIIEPFLTGDFQLISPMIIVIDCIGWMDGEFLLNTLVWLENAFRHHTIPLQIFITSEPKLYSSANLQFPGFLDNALTLHLPRFESSASLSPSRSLFLNRGQRIYKVSRKTWYLLFLQYTEPFSDRTLHRFLKARFLLNMLQTKGGFIFAVNGRGSRGLLCFQALQ